MTEAELAGLNTDKYSLDLIRMNVEGCKKMGGHTPEHVSYFLSVIPKLLSHIDRQQKAIDVYKAQIDNVMIGGNHLASCLIGSLGGGFADKFPPSMNSIDVLEAMGSIPSYDVWCAWKAIMIARDDIAKAEAILRGEDV